MGSNNFSYRSFLHSSVKTSDGFQLIEAYLSYKETTKTFSQNDFHIADAKEIEFSGNEDSENKSDRRLTSSTLFNENSKNRIDTDFINESHDGRYRNPIDTHKLEAIHQKKCFKIEGNHESYTPLESRKIQLYEQQSLDYFTENGLNINFRI